MVKSEITGIFYEEKEVVRLRNPLQVAAYMNKGCRLLDVYISASDKKLVFIMSKAETLPYYILWQEHQLGLED